MELHVQNATYVYIGQNYSIFPEKKDFNFQIMFTEFKFSRNCFSNQSIRCIL